MLEIPISRDYEHNAGSSSMRYAAEAATPLDRPAEIR